MRARAEEKNMRSNVVVTLLSLALVLLGLSFPAPAAAAGVEKEAKRQLSLARAALAAGNYDRATHSAKSALRLDPTLFDALLIQGLAHEGRGELDEGRVLALAYLGAVGWEAADPRAVDLLDPYTDEMPVHIEVEREGKFTIVSFSARDDIEDPVLHWRKPNGGWQSVWMSQNESGDWVYTMRLKSSQTSIVWWVEPTVGKPVIDRDGDDEKPFLLALR